MTLYIIIGLVVIILLYVLITYNGLVKSNNFVKEAFSTMDVYLKKRWDLIPNLVEVVKGYAKHEKETIENITSLRTNAYESMSIDKKININEQLTQGLSRIMAISENYPDLKASQNFIELSRDLTKIEDEIANSRKYYNGTVRIFNNKIQMFPSNIIANMFGFHSANMFEANADEKNNVKDHLDNDHQQTKPQQTVYWYECYLCGLYVDSNVSLEDAKKKFDQTKCTDAIEFSGIEWRHSRFHYGINHF